MTLPCSCVNYREFREGQDPPLQELLFESGGLGLLHFKVQDEQEGGEGRQDVQAGYERAAGQDITQQIVKGENDGAVGYGRPR